MGTGRRRTLLSMAGIMAALVACSGPASVLPSDSPSPTGEASASPTVAPSPSPRPLSSLEPNEQWHPLLELISGPGGRDSGSFAVGSRYRIVYDCVGDGSIGIRVAGRLKARRDCTNPGESEPELVRGLNGGRLQAHVVANGDVQWVARFEVPA